MRIGVYLFHVQCGSGRDPGCLHHLHYLDMSMPDSPFFHMPVEFFAVKQSFI